MLLSSHLCDFFKIYIFSASRFVQRNEILTLAADFALSKSIYALHWSYVTVNFFVGTFVFCFSLCSVSIQLSYIDFIPICTRDLIHSLGSFFYSDFFVGKHRSNFIFLMEIGLVSCFTKTLSIFSETEVRVLRNFILILWFLYVLFWIHLIKAQLSLFRVWLRCSLSAKL